MLEASEGPRKLTWWDRKPVKTLKLASTISQIILISYIWDASKYVKQNHIAAQ